MKSVFKIAVMTSLVLCSGLARAQDGFITCYNGDLETVKKMVDQHPELVNARNDSGRFPLEMAAQTGKIEVVMFLLAKGADVNMNRGGVTALHMAALYGGNTALVSLLLEKVPDINAWTGEGAGGSDGNIWVVEREGPSWSEPRPLDEPVNTTGREINAGGHERFPSVTPDGRYLFFLRVNDGSDFFWVDAKIIDAFRREVSR